MERMKLEQFLYFSSNFTFFPHISEICKKKLSENISINALKKMTALPCLNGFTDEL